MYGKMSFAMFALVLAGCTWVKPVPGAEKVELVPAKLAASCKDMGSVKVSALDQVGILSRHDEEVEEDLLMLAKNKAAEKGADTLIRLSAVENGEQRFGMRHCGTSGSPPDDGGETGEESGVEVLPYED